MDSIDSGTRPPTDAATRPTMLTLEQREQRAERVWQKYLNGKTVSLEEFLALRRRP
jgi:uncharacterized coiled-coil DUF342 family protein